MKNQFVLLIFLCLTACSSVFHQPGSDLIHTYSKTYLTDYNTAWQSARDALTSFTKESENRQFGVIQTTWGDNTAQKNFTDTFGGSETYLKAKYRLTVTVAPVPGAKSAVKVSVQKEQLVQRDVLEGWKGVQSDTIDENTILYRIGRIIAVKQRLKEIEEEKTRKLLEDDSVAGDDAAEGDVVEGSGSGAASGGAGSEDAELDKTNSVDLQN